MTHKMVEISIFEKFTHANVLKSHLEVKNMLNSPL